MKWVSKENSLADSALACERCLSVPLSLYILTCSLYKFVQVFLFSGEIVIHHLMSFGTGADRPTCLME